MKKAITQVISACKMKFNFKEWFGLFSTSKETFINKVVLSRLIKWLSIILSIYIIYFVINNLRFLWVYGYVDRGENILLTEYIKIILTIISGLLAIFGIYIAFKRLKIADDNNKSFAEQVANYKTQLKHSERTDYFNQYLESLKILGDKEATLSSKLGVLFILENIGKETEYFRQQVVDILIETNKAIKEIANFFEGKIDKVDFEKWILEDRVFEYHPVHRSTIEDQKISATICKILNNIIDAHCREENTQKPLYIRNTILPLLHLENLTIKANSLQFSNCVFYFLKINGFEIHSNKLFDKCSFYGKTMFQTNQNGKYMFSKFLGDVHMSNCEFHSEVLFRKTNFYGRLICRNSFFHAELSFWELVLNGVGNFENADFSESDTSANFIVVFENWSTIKLNQKQIDEILQMKESGRNYREGEWDKFFEKYKSQPSDTLIHN